MLDDGDKDALRVLLNERKQRPSWTAVIGSLVGTVALTITVAGIFLQVGGKNEQINSLDAKITQLIAKVDQNAKLTETRIGDLQKADQFSLLDRNEAKNEIRHLQEADRAFTARLNLVEGAVSSVNTALNDIKIQIVTLSTQLSRSYSEIERRLPASPPLRNPPPG